MLSALIVFITLLAYVEATGKVAPCPPGCSCHLTYFDSQMYVDCSHGFPNVDTKQLSRQFDLMLSADHLVERLTSLRITNTTLTHVPPSVCKLVNLTSLNLNDNRLTELPDNCFTKLTKLVTLSAKRNSITCLQDGLFDGMQSLVTLDISGNLIAFIGVRVFSNSSDLTSLRSLNLAYNRLTSLEPWPYYRCILGNKTSRVTVHLNDNLISNFTNKLEFEFRCGMTSPYCYVDISWNRIRYIMDIFNGWNMVGSSIFTTTICLRRCIGTHGTHHRFSFDIGGDAYVCDCKDIEFYKMANVMQSSSFMKDVRCKASSSFLSDIGQPRWATTIPLNEFVCVLSDRCPSGCRCVYRPANATLHVYCSAANLSSLPLDLPPLPKSYVKYKLDFSNNKLLRRLEHRPYFVNTSIMDVSNCSLTEITVEMLKDMARFSLVNLRENVLQTFPRQADTVNISARLLIGNNPWRCSCDNSWMIGWLQSLSGQISDPGDIACASPPRMYNRNVLKSSVEDFCVDPVKYALKHALTITLSAASSVIFVIFLLIMSVILVYKLRVKCFRRWKFHPFDRDECDGEDMKYDVFLSCSSKDEVPHGRHILEMMESNGYRVCYHERDFLPGSLITDNIGQGIERSKRSVCLLSDNFLRR